MNDRPFDLAGKDYLSEKEAAVYCCCSVKHFRNKSREGGLQPGKLWGKNIYRRADLQRIIETTAWSDNNVSNLHRRIPRL